MATFTPASAVLSVGQSIGRYFALVSMMPSLFLVLWTYILIASGSLSGTPTLHNVEVALSHWSVGKVAGVVLASLAIALVVHPLEFITTQLLEGYWGTSALARRAMKVRIVYHRRRQRRLMQRVGISRRKQNAMSMGILREEFAKHPERKKDPQMRTKRIKAIMSAETGDSIMGYVAAEQEALDEVNSYPDDLTRILPTRLGNALRNFEDSTGRQYGLRILPIAPHLHLVASPRHLDYLEDAREDMDSAIRICTVGLVATALSVGFLMTKGLWLLWAVLPYSVSYLSYKGAVSAAQGYGAVVASVLDLDRFLLYKELGLNSPKDTDEERESNAKLMQLLGREEASLSYRQENATSGHSSFFARLRRKPED
jgi:hypothetical protein